MTGEEPGEQLVVTREEAQTMYRLVNAYSSALTVVEQLTPILVTMGLLKPGGALNADRVLKIHNAAIGRRKRKRDGS